MFQYFLGYFMITSPFTHQLQHWILYVGSSYNNCTSDSICLSTYSIKHVISIFPCAFAWREMTRVNFIDAKLGHTGINMQSFNISRKINMNGSFISILFNINRSFKLRWFELARIIDKLGFISTGSSSVFSTITLIKQHRIAKTFN